MWQVLNHRRVTRFVDVLLRVPPLFIIDEILKAGVSFADIPADNDFINQKSAGHDDVNNIVTITNHSNIIFSSSSSSSSSASASSPSQSPIDDITNTYDSTMYRYLFMYIFQILLSSTGCLAALCLFVLKTKHLMPVYIYLMSVGIVFVSYWTNVSTMKTAIATFNVPDVVEVPRMLEDFLSLNFNKIIDPDGPSFPILQNLLLQLGLTFVFMKVHLGPRYRVLQSLLPLSFLAPSVLAMLPMPASVLQQAPIFSALLPLAVVKFVVWASLITISRIIYSGLMHTKTYLTQFGMSALIEAEWSRLGVPQVLRTFWILRVFEHTGIFFISDLWNGGGGGVIGGGLQATAGAAAESNLTPAFRLLKSTLVTGCDTLTAVLGITSIVSYLCHHIGKFFQWILLTNDDNDKGLGTVSAILFYILALQTGLTSLEPEKRFVRLCRNFCLLFTALLHFIHNTVNPLLMSLSASHNPSKEKHFRALAVCGFLVLFPILLLYYLWSHHPVSTWLLAVSAFSTEVIVKVAVSLCIYSLFLLDARKETFWERLDDYVYYIRAFGNTVEFCFGIFLFFNGAWILAFESGGAIRAVMMCIHAYFNIWCDARAGWSVFMKRRSAVKKIDSLPEAAEHQLKSLDDVCAICYQDMQTAKITRCKHFFHGVCLRKWLYVQDRCPLCHEILHAANSGNTTPAADAPQQEEQQQQQPPPPPPSPLPPPQEEGGVVVVNHR
ncbi:PREDICTED: protein TRC8 homolog [Nicrophorus vespilloides]|uniref:Protein TRC8 homolog n=1 Tax=Nicrophorus vespilloides TaxID=110193 RepID=A0ABM1MAL6_NICVS|nr:PREDICTED: protein TRC8 homolog [Nicrophorus vespilloides]